MKLTINEQLETTIYLVDADHDLSMLTEVVKEYAQEKFEFAGSLNETFTYLGPNTDNIILVGLGSADKLTKDKYVQAANKAAKLLEENKVSEASVKVEAFGTINEQAALQGIAEGVLQASYTFDEYKSNKAIASLDKVSLLSEMENAEELLTETQILIDSVNITRDLVNTPANDLYPSVLADKVVEMFKDTSANVEVYDKACLEEIGAEALLAVSQGSIREPRLIVIEYLPLGKDVPAISLVGKGVTYDSGGYAIKTAKGMQTMMTDMAGAGAMVGVMQALVKNNIQQNVVAIIGATENLISDKAMKNGDIIKTLKGTTIEVINTDAEGRLVLADALYYAATKVNSKCIIDAATLTGAVIAALGMNITGVMTNDDLLLDDVLEASKAAGEDMWQLPITDEFRNKIKGLNADLTNSAINHTGAGTIFAAAFLEHFVEEVPWVHLDIAGTSYARTKGNKYLPKGASGIPVKTLYEFVKNTVN